MTARRASGLLLAGRVPIAAAVVLAAAVALVVVPTATRTTAADGAYVALGDSYSSGVGAGRYLQSSGACVRSRRAFAYRLGRRVSSFRACAGARTGDVLRRQLERFPRDTRLVTITIGGNDAGFFNVLSTCLLAPPATCDRRVDGAERFVRRRLRGRLRRVYRAIRRRAPGAVVVVAGYPRLFAGKPWCDRVGMIDEREQRRLNAGADLLARTIRAEAGRHRGFRFADVRAAFRGHEVCSRAPRIRGVSVPRFESFHPSARGQLTYARAIARRP